MRKSIGVLAKLPQELEYLIEPAMKYGVHQDDIGRGEFIRRLTEEQMEELAGVAERYRLNEHHDLVGRFLDEYPITDYREAANLYWLFVVMDEAGLQLSADNWNTVERHIETLGKFGSFRLASERAFAARFLSDFGGKARPAIPALRRALQDEDLRVQVWAHYALAVIEGNRSEHERAVRAIYSRHDRKDEYGCHIDDVGGDASAAIEKFAELRRR
jgi:hypothetical protein